MNPVFVNKDCSALAEVLQKSVRGKLFVVCDKNVRSFVDNKVLPALGGSFADIPVYEICATESLKTLETVQNICEWLLNNSADRKSFVLSVGGGICSDMTGFAASIYMRGIGFAYVPTTLLAMTDAAIGGKTAVNFLSYKNILGTFTEPEFTYMAAEALVGLPYRELLGGASEMVKTFIIENENCNYEKSIEFFDKCKGREYCDLDMALEMMPLVQAAAMVKAGIVTRDFKEGGERRKLNLGHTFAHAIEHLAQEEGRNISHGEAVSMGMVLAARLSEKIKIAEGSIPASESGLEAALVEDFRRAGLVVDCPYEAEELTAAMTRDKKAESGTIAFVLIASVGDVYIRNFEAAQAVELL